MHKCRSLVDFKAKGMMNNGRWQWQVLFVLLSSFEPERVIFCVPSAFFPTQLCRGCCCWTSIRQRPRKKKASSKGIRDAISLWDRQVLCLTLWVWRLLTKPSVVTLPTSFWQGAPSRSNKMKCWWPFLHPVAAVLDWQFFGGFDPLSQSVFYFLKKGSVFFFSNIIKNRLRGSIVGERSCGACWVERNNKDGPAAAWTTWIGCRSVTLSSLFLLLFLKVFSNNCVEGLLCGWVSDLIASSVTGLISTLFNSRTVSWPFDMESTEKSSIEEKRQIWK